MKVMASTGLARAGRWRWGISRCTFRNVLVAMQKNVVGAGVAEDIDAGVAGDLFGAVAPEDNFFLQVEHAHADLQAVEDVAVSIGIAKGWHSWRKECCWFLHRQKMLATSEARARQNRNPARESAKSWICNGLGDGTLGTAEWHESAICKILRHV